MGSCVAWSLRAFTGVCFSLSLSPGAKQLPVAVAWKQYFMQSRATLNHADRPLGKRKQHLAASSSNEKVIKEFSLQTTAYFLRLFLGQNFSVWKCVRSRTDNGGAKTLNQLVGNMQCGARRKPRSGGTALGEQIHRGLTSLCYLC